MKYSDYLALKKMVWEDETTTNYVAEFLNVPPIVARCLVKDWKEQQEKMEELERLVERERNAQEWLVNRIAKAEKEIDYFKDVITDAVSSGEAQGENMLLEPWNSLKDVADKFTKSK